jgi:type IV secretion system protein VirD4
MRSRILIAAVALALLGAGLVASVYLAGALYFVANKTLPQAVDIGTWQAYWTAYAHHPQQRPRLVFSAVAAPVIVFGLPLLLLAHHAPRQRPLYGDARWACRDDLKKAGLL